MATQIKNPRRLPLPKQADTILRTMFAAYEAVIIQRDYTAVSLSGSFVYQVELIRQRKTELPVIVKLSPVHLIKKEAEAYQAHIKNKWPCVAELYEAPVFLYQFNIAAICYRFVGSGIFPYQSLAEFFVEADEETVHDVLKQRLFHIMQFTIERYAEQQANFPMHRSYDAVLPVNLYLQQGSDMAAQQVLTPDSLATCLQEDRLTIGTVVQIADFVITEINPIKATLTVNLPPHHPLSAYRIRLTTTAYNKSYDLGQALPELTGVIIETRHNFLAEQIRTVISPQSTPTAPTFVVPHSTPEETLPNPLLALPELLRTVRSVKISAIHGDLNLQNIMVDADIGDVKLIDFATSRQDHVLHDFLRLETEIITHLMPPAFIQANLPTETIYNFYLQLHYATFHAPQFEAATSPDVALAKPFRVLKAMRKVVREQALFDPDDYSEYYNGLTIYLLAALKFENLDKRVDDPQPHPKQLAFWGAATLQRLLKQPLPPPIEISPTVEVSYTLPNFKQIFSYLRTIQQSEAYQRWARTKGPIINAGQDRFLDEKVKLLPNAYASPFQLQAIEETHYLIDLLESRQRLMILGKSGTGKTTVLQRLAWEIISHQETEIQADTPPQDKPHIPVLIHLFDLNTNLMERIVEELNLGGKFQLNIDMLQRWMISEEVIFTFMFDGLNELPRERCQFFIGQLTRTMNRDRYLAHRYVITSRIHYDVLWERLRHEVNDLDVGVVLPLEEEQVRAYLKAHLGPTKWQAVWQGMDSRLRELARRPLMLWLIKEAAAQNDGSALPRNRGELFNNFIDRALKLEATKKDFQLSDSQKRYGLTCLAWELQCQNQLTTPFYKAVDVVANQAELSEVEARNLILEARFNGLLDGEAHLSFVHQALQEHFVAHRLRSRVEAWRRDTDNLKEKMLGVFFDDQMTMWARDDWWAEPFIHTAGLVDEPDWFINKLAYRTPWLAYWCMEEGQTVSQQTRRRVREKSRDRLNSPKPSVRRRAVETLLTRDNDRVTRDLSDLLADDDPNIGRLIYQTFRTRENLSIEPLLPLLEKPQTRIRRWAVELIVRQNSDFAAGHLIPRLLDSDDQIGQIAYNALLKAKELPTSKLFGFLRHLLTATGHSKKSARNWVARILAARPEAAITDQLLAELENKSYNSRPSPNTAAQKNHPATEFHVHITDILAKRFAGPAKDDRRVPPVLITQLTDYDTRVRQIAYEALSTQPTLPIEPLRPLLTNGHHVDTRRYATELLNKCFNLDVIRDLIPLLQDKDAVVAKNAFLNLTQYSDLPSDPLLPLLESSNSDTRHRAVVLLAASQEPTVVQSMISLLQDKNREVSKAVYNKLIAQKGLPPRPLTTLLKAATITTKKRVLNLVIHACQRDRGIVYDLIPLLQDKNGEVVQKTFELLRTYPDLPAPPLVELAQKPDNQVRTQVIKLLFETKSTLPHKVDFIHIPEGFFWLGSDVTRSKREKPEHELYLSSYWISRHPVTIAQFNDYLQAMDQPIVQHNLDHPLTEISWLEAMTYCQWLSEQTGLPLSLPTEAQWEKAARGSGKRLFPWGSEWAHHISRCNTLENGTDGTLPVNQFSPIGDSPYGCQDMVGNVWEWTTSEYRPYPYKDNDGRENLQQTTKQRTVRGGSFQTKAAAARVTTRAWRYDTSRRKDVGLRLVIKFS